MRTLLSVLAGFPIVVALASPALAQAPATLMVPVEGHVMRAQLGGQELLGKLPLVIFESGGGGWSVEGWRPIFNDIAKVAPVFAYDRAGYGQSAPDPRAPTPQHNAETLHRLLQILELPPPYVLVGHSWGGPLIRMFAALYPAEIAGMVYLDPTDLHSREQEIEHLRAIGYTADGAANYITGYRRDFAAYIATLPPEVQVEMKLIDDIERRDAPEFRQLPPVPNVPVSIVLAGKREAWIWEGKPCQPDVCYERRLEFRQRWLTRWIPNATTGSMLVDMASGHVVPSDNPALVADEIRRVLSLTKAN